MTARHPRHRLAASAAAVVVAVGLGACSGGDDDDSFSVRQALDELPASTLVDGYSVTVTDLDRATEFAGLERPGPDASEDDLADWLLPLTGVARERDSTAVTAAILPEASNPQRAMQADEFRDELGWAITDVAWFAEAAALPARFTVLHGDFDVDAIDRAIGDREDDVWSIGGDDFELDPEAISTARQYGQSLRLAERDGILAVSASTPPIEDWLDGDDDRVGDDDDLVAVAEALDAHDVYTAMLLDGESMTFGSSNLTPEQLASIEDDLLDDFEAFGAALTVVDGEPVGVLVFGHATSADAQDNAERLEETFDHGQSGITARPLTEMFEDVEVAVDGEVVTVTFGFVGNAPPGLLWNAVFARDTFISHA